MNDKGGPFTKTPHSVQLRIARTALGWSLDKAARKSDISRRTLHRLEIMIGEVSVNSRSLEKIMQCYDKHGVVFIDDEASLGVKIARRRKPPVG